MTGKPTDPRIAAAALKHDCPRCHAKPGVRCTALYWANGKANTVRRHVRIHSERLGLGHKVVKAENTARLRAEFGRLGDAV